VENKAKTIFNKPDDYYSEDRDDMAALIEAGDNVVLEIGCGKGNTGLILREKNTASKLVGVEINPEMAAAAGKVFDQVICGNVEDMELPGKYGPYDYVICGDVLEHLHNPWATLKKVHMVVKPGGFIIASIPTIRNWRVMRDLVFKGEFTYRESGTLDITHLRFFTKKSIRKLFEESNFKVLRIEPNTFGTKASLVNNVTFGIFEEFLTLRYLVKAKRA
jgi:2-polyprenyl-3-methyl-5-hydroxy-6-metoxy-1,4-benzoquinol methylase